MKRNDLSEFKKMDVKALRDKVKSLRKEITDMVVEKSTNKQTNLRSMKFKRRDVAQILTVIRQKDLLVEVEGVKDAK